MARRLAAILAIAVLTVVGCSNDTGNDPREATTVEVLERWWAEVGDPYQASVCAGWNLPIQSVQKQTVGGIISEAGPFPQEPGYDEVHSWYQSKCLERS